jgi:hypothetical protein
MGGVVLLSAYGDRSKWLRIAPERNLGMVEDRKAEQGPRLSPMTSRTYLLHHTYPKDDVRVTLCIGQFKLN